MQNNHYKHFAAESIKLLHAALLCYRNEITRHKLDALKSDGIDKQSKLIIEENSNKRIEEINAEMQLLMQCINDVKTIPTLP